MPSQLQNKPRVLHRLLRVLIADDSSIARTTVKKGVSSQRDQAYLETIVCSDGDEAFKILHSKPIDLAFFDINMPGMNGPELVASLRDTPSKNCMTIAMSSHLDDTAEQVLRKYGAYHFIQKPFSYQDVADIFTTFIIITRTYPILLVDDSNTMRRLARRVLEKCRFSFDIHEAHDAESAVKTLLEVRPELVLTDFQMPNIDGIELAGAIRRASEDIGIYMMSTNYTSHLERSAAFIGINGFLKKPFVPDDVDTIMHRYLGLDDPAFGKNRAMFSFLERNQKGAA
nr:response regulator [uncultured Cohaesibacter sp.]